VIDGFRRSFDKKGIFIKKRGILQSMEIKQPLKIDYENESIDAIVEKLQFAIEQHPSMMKVIPEKELKAYESENKWGAMALKSPYILCQITSFGERQP
jgi:hypothetical protein